VERNPIRGAQLSSAFFLTNETTSSWRASAPERSGFSFGPPCGSCHANWPALSSFSPSLPLPLSLSLSLSLFTFFRAGTRKAQKGDAPRKRVHAKSPEQSESSRGDPKRKAGLGLINQRPASGISMIYPARLCNRPPPITFALMIRLFAVLPAPPNIYLSLHTTVSPNSDCNCYKVY